MSKVTDFWHVAFILVEKHCPEFFFLWLAFQRMQKTLIFVAGLFAICLS